MAESNVKSGTLRPDQGTPGIPWVQHSQLARLFIACGFANLSAEHSGGRRGNHFGEFSAADTASVEDMASPFDVSSLNAISAAGVAPGAMAFALRSQTARVGKASENARETTVKASSRSAFSSPEIAFDPVRSASRSRTVEELDKFAAKEEDNRASLQEHLQSLEGSVSSVQSSRSFMSGFALK